ncbi:MAG: hypothetical protein RPU13_13815 [Candidatus Sedimenticola sp. (ex Thyasira tokunagai)]
MAWPNDNLDTTEFDQGTDSPGLARAMLYALINIVKSIIGARGQADGVADLDAEGKLPNGRIRIGEAGGVAGLDGGGKVPSVQLPAMDFAASQHGHSESDIGDLDKYTQAQVDQMFAGLDMTPGADSVGSSALKDTWADAGGEYSNATSYWYPVGWYAFFPETYAYDETNHYLGTVQLKINNTWRGICGKAFGTVIAGFVPCDGTNVRVRAAHSATPVHYRRLA